VGAVAPVRAAPSTHSVPVVFAKSLKEARWTPDAGTLLELAEARGLQPQFSCRTGSCGTCRTTLIAGQVTYINEPSASLGEGEVLPCSAVPAQTEGASENRIELEL
jgi:uncharacterized protein